MLRREELYFRTASDGDEVLPEAARACMRGKKDARAALLLARPARLLGWAAGHPILLDDLYAALGSLEACSYVRQHASGQILLVDGWWVPDMDLSLIHISADGGGVHAPAGVGKAAIVALQHHGVGQQLLAEGDGLRALQMGVARHDGILVGARLRVQGRDDGQHERLQRGDLVFQIQPQVKRCLLYTSRCV